MASRTKPDMITLVLPDNGRNQSQDRSRKPRTHQTTTETSRFLPQDHRNNETETPSSFSGESKDRSINSSTLRRHNFPLWIVTFYSVLVLLSWSLTCVLVRKPIQFDTYDDQKGRLRPQQFDVNDKWRKTARTISAIVAAITIPVTSTVCASAAVIYTQRGSGKHRALNMTLRKTLALADRGWSDLSMLGAILTGNYARVGSPLLLFSAFLIGIGLLLQPLQQVLVTVENTKVMTCQALSNCSNWDLRRTTSFIGYEPELNQIASVPLANVANELMNRIVQDTSQQAQPQVWLDLETSNYPPYLPNGVNLNWMLLFNDSDAKNAFISSFPNATNTGVLRSHALRLNSTHSCSQVESFPDQCEGDLPFSVSYQNVPQTGQWKFDLRVCVPGNYTASPWALNRDRQDINEELFLHWQTIGSNNSYNIHCTATTTRGYFELPNYWNKNKPGPLMEKWPTPEVINSSFNEPATGAGRRNNGVSALPDIMADSYYGFQVIGMALDNRYGGRPAPGPLTVAAVALFGNASFLGSIAHSKTTEDGVDDVGLCQQLRIPFKLFSGWNSEMGFACDPIRHVDDLKSHMYIWLSNLKEESKLRYVFGASIFHANQATLSLASQFGGPTYARSFTSSPGYDVLRLRMSGASMVIISVLIAIQLAGLIFLAIYSYKATWTRSLSAFAVLRMGACVYEEVPLISAVDSRKVRMLDTEKGWIGALSEDLDDKQHGLSTLTVGGDMGLDAKRRYRVYNADSSEVVQ